MDDSVFTSKISICGGPGAVHLRCVALLITDSPQTFINTHALGSMERLGAASAIFECHTPPRLWGAFGKPPHLDTSVAVLSSVHFFHDDQPTASLTAWAYIAPSEAIEHVVLLGRGSWMRFHDLSYRTLASCQVNTLFVGELTLSLPGLHGATAFVPDSSAHPESFHLLYADATGIALSHVHRLSMSI